MGREDIKALVNDKDWKTLYLADQLRVEKEAGNVFQDFHEGIIEFPPTYKYDLFSDDYDTSEKCRAPAWTDRVLWRRKALQGESLPCPGLVHWYGRSELKQSDHRPVLAVLDAEVLKVDEAKRGQIFEDSLSLVGPPDGSVMLKVMLFD